MGSVATLDYKVATLPLILPLDPRGMTVGIPSKPVRWVFQSRMRS